jgi:hypothetical protein
LYSTLLFLSFCMDFGIAETGIACGSPPGTTTEVLRFGVPIAEIRVVSDTEEKRIFTFDNSTLLLGRWRAFLKSSCWFCSSLNHLCTGFVRTVAP